MAQDGMEILRRSMGGHGTSYYSGIPQIMNEYAANNTHEGENTVMYLQSAQYVLKSYIGYLTKGTPLTDSVKFIERIQDVSELQFAGKQAWSVEEMRDVFVKTLAYLIGVISGRMANKEPGEKDVDIINYQVGIRLQQLAQMYGVHYMVDELVSAISR